MLKCTVYGWAWTQLEEQSPYQYGGMNSHTNNDNSVYMVWFLKSAIETSMSNSSPVTSFNFEAKLQEAHKLWEGVFTVW